MNIEITIHLFSAIVWTLWVTFGLLALLAKITDGEYYTMQWRYAILPAKVIVIVGFALFGIFQWKQIIEMETENG